MEFEGLPPFVNCNNKPDGKRTCGALAQPETVNPAQQHAFYRCLKQECKGVVVVCFNRRHA